MVHTDHGIVVFTDDGTVVCMDDGTVALMDKGSIVRASDRTVVRAPWCKVILSRCRGKGICPHGTRSRFEQFLIEYPRHSGWIFLSETDVPAWVYGDVIKDLLWTFGQVF